MLIGIILFLTACESTVEQTSAEKEPETKEQVPAQDSDQQDDLISAIIAAAESGRIAEAPFQIGSTHFQDVKDEWGEPDQVNQAGYGYYAEYAEKGVTVGYIKEGLIFDVRSYNDSLHTITYAKIEEILGEPDEKTYYGTDDIYVYQLNEEFQLKFIIPQKEKGVHHISVINEKVLDTTTQEYVLDIKGISSHLPAETWESMLAWRKEIQIFAQSYDHMWLNGPDHPRVALTFDDGPDEENVTNSVIDILDQYGVKGTFFFVGENVEKYPDVVEKAANSGHLVLGHSYLHENLKSKNFQGVVEDLQKTEAAIQAVTGKAPALFRPPFGDTDLDVVNAAKQEGYNIILWSIDTIDWADGAVSEEIVENVVSNIRNGDIILMHTTKERVETPKALPIIIEELQKQKFELVDVATLLELKPYK